MADQKNPNARESFNRLVGLGNYAMGVVVLGAMAFCIYVDGGIKGDYTAYGIGLAAIFVFFGIGYTTGRRNRK